MWLQKASVRLCCHLAYLTRYQTCLDYTCERSCSQILVSDLIVAVGARVDARVEGIETGEPYNSTGHHQERVSVTCALVTDHNMQRPYSR